MNFWLLLIWIRSFMILACSCFVSKTLSWGLFIGSCSYVKNAFLGRLASTAVEGLYPWCLPILYPMFSLSIIYISRYYLIAASCLWSFVGAATATLPFMFFSNLWSVFKDACVLSIVGSCGLLLSTCERLRRYLFLRWISSRRGRSLCSMTLK